MKLYQKFSSVITVAPGPIYEQSTPVYPLTNQATGLMPSMQDWPGKFDFKIRVKESDKARDPQVRTTTINLFTESIYNHVH